MGYRCVATSLGGFVQQLAVNYVARGYWFYVVGGIPERKDPAAVDAKLVARYRVDCSKFVKAREKKAGLAKVQYLRHGRLFVLLATPGRHRLFDDEASVIRDVRRVPLVVGGYSVSSIGDRCVVRIARDDYSGIRRRLVRVALAWPREDLEAEFARLPFEPYSMVRAQYLRLFRAVNRLRKRAGLEPVSSSCLRVSRRIYRPFEPTVDALVSEGDERKRNPFG